jgi:hypothetical protein
MMLPLIMLLAVVDDVSCLLEIRTASSSSEEFPSDQNNNNNDNNDHYGNANNVYGESPTTTVVKRNKRHMECSYTRPRYLDAIKKGASRLFGKLRSALRSSNLTNKKRKNQIILALFRRHQARQLLAL